MLSLAISKPTFAEPALPGEPCNLPPRDTWTKPESWAWQRICVGETADFNARTGVTLDPRNLEGWSGDRTLSSGFLKTILLYDPYRGALTHKGVRIVGGWFREPIDLENARIHVELKLDGSRFDQPLSFRSMRTEGLLSLFGSKFSGKLNMDKIAVGEDLFMDGDAEFQDVDLTGAEIGGQISAAGSKFKGKLNMESVEVGQFLLMYGGAEFEDVNIRSAKIGGQISMVGSTFVRRLDMESAEIGRSVFAMGTTFERGAAWSLIFAKIHSNLDLSGATMSDLDLTGTRIEGELSLGRTTGYGPTAWADGSELILRNTAVGALQDEPDAWPETLELEGFTYGQLGGLGAEGTADIEKRSSGWFIDWLARDPSYSPQPYGQLAAVLTEGGRAEKADNVLYAGRERERLELQRRLLAGQGSLQAWLDFLWKSSLHAVIGYGFKIHRAFYWITAFVVLGTVVIWLSRQLTRYRIATGAAGTTPLEYSIDMLLPIIELRKQHYDIDLTGPVRYYFYVHKIMGFVLVSFLIAGLSGLTK
jgi:hypothetical protein